MVAVEDRPPARVFVAAIVVLGTAGLVTSVVTTGRDERAPFAPDPAPPDDEPAEAGVWVGDELLSRWDVTDPPDPD